MARRARRDGYELKLNSYDLSVDIELADIERRLCFEHPGVRVLVVSSELPRISCCDANIHMLGASTHAFKVSFSKFTNKTRLYLEDMSAECGIHALAALNGTCAGGGYELPVVAHGGMSSREVPLRNAMNEVPRDDYVGDCVFVCDRWNRVLEKLGHDERVYLLNRRLNREVGLHAGHHCFLPAPRARTAEAIMDRRQPGGTRVREEARVAPCPLRGRGLPKRAKPAGSRVARVSELHKSGANAMTPKPTGVRLDLTENLLAITWSDGLESQFDGSYLRFICPCAECRGHAPGEVPPPEWSRCAPVRMTHVEGVGSYALRFTLSDGHASGIYSYDHLRSEDPANAPERDERGRPLEA